jgi:hypothetical protein
MPEAKVDVTKPLSTYMYIETINDHDPATVIDFGRYVDTVIVGTDKDIHVSFNADDIEAGYTKIKALEVWCLDLICNKLAVKAVSDNSVEVRVQVLWGEEE